MRNMGVNDISIYFLFLIFFICVGVLGFYILSPFDNNPIFVEKIDITGLRKPEIEEQIDLWLIDGHFTTIQDHEEVTNFWMNKAITKLRETKYFKKHREEQYEHALKKSCQYTFVLTKNQTRYQQRNYEKYSYIVEQEVGTYVFNYDYLKNRYKQLQDINFECTLKQYNSKNQRKLMTKQLRKTVMERDNYTCQCCGKYMPDEIGLQVDHIIPINKGGKTVLSNLQVLCSKCNGRKSDKL